jgi:hypothetical protein
MPEEKQSDDVEKVLADLKGIEGRKQALIDDLLRQKAEAVKAFDDKLAKLGYQAKDHAGKPQKSHHKKAPEKPKAPAGPSAGPSPAQTKTKRKA